MTDGPRTWLVPGYTHIRELGAGASGRVFVARENATGTLVAIKYLSDAVHSLGDFRSRYRREAELLGGLRSPYVARFYEYTEVADAAAIVMELIDGHSLSEVLKQAGPTGPEAALAVLKGSLLGLHAAHEAGLVHRDYKPGNVLITADGSSKLVDFGVAVVRGDTDEAAGTPAYMPPEQWQAGAITAAADVYAATATFFECLTGERPYSGSTTVELMMQHASAPIPDELAPEPLRPLIRRGLAKDPADRPADAAAFVAELEACAAAFGEDWEERGQRKLATLFALLPLLDFNVQDAAPSGGTALATTILGPGAPHAGRKRVGRRALAGVALGVVVLGGAAISAIGATGSDSPSTSAASDRSAAPEAFTTGGSPTGASGAGATSAPTQTPSSSGQSAAAAATGAPSATPGPSQSAAGSSPTAGAGPTTGTPASQQLTSSPASAPSSPAAPSSPSPPPPPTLHISSVGITQFGCYARVGASATVQVRSDGAAAGTLYLTWFYSSSATGAESVVQQQNVTLPQGKTTFSGSYSYDFSDAGYGSQPYWGLAVSTSPTAQSGNGSSQSLTSFGCEIQ